MRKHETASIEKITSLFFLIQNALLNASSTILEKRIKKIYRWIYIWVCWIYIWFVELYIWISLNIFMNGWILLQIINHRWIYEILQCSYASCLRSVDFLLKQNRRTHRQADCLDYYLLTLLCPLGFFLITFEIFMLSSWKFLGFNINLLHTCVQNFRPIPCLLFKLCSIIEQVLENSGKKHCIMNIKGKYHNFW